jgi:hypothetical protein
MAGRGRAINAGQGKTVVPLKRAIHEWVWVGQG